MRRRSTGLLAVGGCAALALAGCYTETDVTHVRPRAASSAAPSAPVVVLPPPTSASHAASTPPAPPAPPAAAIPPSAPPPSSTSRDRAAPFRTILDLRRQGLITQEEADRMILRAAEAVK